MTDRLSSYLVKIISESLAYPTSALINRSIKEGQVPNCMETAKLLPLYKSKKRNQMTNYMTYFNTTSTITNIWKGGPQMGL